MVRRFSNPGVAAAIIATLVVGTAWSEPAADPRHPDDRSSSVVLPLSAPALGSVVTGGADDARGSPGRRDKRAASSSQVLATLLAGLALAALAGARSIGSGRDRRATVWTVRALGARSPPLALG